MRAELRVEKLVYGGSGLARYGDKVVFVPFVLPGEQVEAELSFASAGVMRGTAVGWRARSPDRVQPPCPVFALCGGCHYQHMPYDKQCAFKVGILRETLRRIGGLRWENDIDLVTAEPWGYRNRAQFHLGLDNGKAAVGFLAAGSHRHMPVRECAINSPKHNALLETAQQCSSAFRLRAAPRRVEFFTDQRQVQVNFPRWRGPIPKGFWSRCADCFDLRHAGQPLEYRCGADVFRVSGRSFFQVNRFLIERLAEVAIGPNDGNLALDLYCGVGLLSVPLARQFKSVIAIDSSVSATRDARWNASRAGVAIRTVRADAASFLAQHTERPDLMVADPPRAGLGGAVVSQMLRIAPRELRLVSCDPATLARDIKALVAGGYVLEALTLLDFFPQTYHIETVAVLRLASGMRRSEQLQPER